MQRSEEFREALFGLTGLAGDPVPCGAVSELFDPGVNSVLNLLIGVKCKSPTGSRRGASCVDAIGMTAAAVSDADAADARVEADADTDVVADVLDFELLRRRFLVEVDDGTGDVGN